MTSKPWTAPNAPLENPEPLKDLIARAKKGTYVLKDHGWYLHRSGSYVSWQGAAQRFAGKAEALAHAATLNPAPRAVKLVRK